MLRSGAQIDDEVWVSGTLGDAALALAHLQENLVLSADEIASCVLALHQPQPRISLGLALRGIASSAIDISDGLLADLGHILDASQVAAQIGFDLLPISPVLQAYIQQPLGKRCVLSGGDDYELCFTAPAMRHAEIMSISSRLGLPLTCIGKIVTGRDCIVHDASGNIINVEASGYDHFK